MLEKPRILIDTTFLLPAIGISVEREAEEIILGFRKLDVYYLEAGLLEAMWKIMKIVPQEKLERVRIGIEAVRNTYKVLEPPPEAYIGAVKIYREGFKDYIDALHYTTAKNTNTPLLTIDYELIEFLRQHNYETEKIILTPKSLRKLLSKQ
jgi:predicted nucleic acid-binding protein